jgi:hypothetical protein
MAPQQALHAPEASAGQDGGFGLRGHFSLLGSYAGRRACCHPDRAYTRDTAFVPPLAWDAGWPSIGCVTMNGSFVPTTT